MPDIALRRLLNQRLLVPGSTPPAEVVRWLVASQAQDYAGAKWAIGLRLPGSTDGDVEQAFATGQLLRTHLLRPTWHFVTPRDIRWLLALTAPRVHVANAFMYRKLGLDGPLLARSHAALVDALRGGQLLTRDELRDALAQAGIETGGEFRMGYLMMAAELDGIVCSGPRRGKRFTYALLDERVPQGRVLDRADALAELAHRYFASRGPATLDDFARWSGLTVTEARTGLEAARSALVQEVLDGRTYWVSASAAAVPAPTEPSAHLLSIYDEYVSGYRDRRAMSDEHTGKRLAALGNALTHIVVIDGRVVGTWKPPVGRRTTAPLTDIFRPLTRPERRSVDVAITRYRDFQQDGSGPLAE